MYILQVIFIFLVIILGSLYVYFNALLLKSNNELTYIANEDISHREVIDFSEEEVLLVTNDYPPYVNGTSLEDSFMVQVIKASLDAANISYRIEVYPWERCRYMVNHGLAWGTFPYVKNENRFKDFIFTDPIIQIDRNTTRLFYYDDKSTFYNIKNLDDLDDYRLSIINNYYYQSYFDYLGIQYDLSTSEKELFNKLKNKRIDFVPSDYYVGKYFIRKYHPNHYNDFKTLDLELDLKYEDYHIMLDKYNTKGQWFIKSFNKGFEIIKNNGTYDQLLKKFERSIE